MKPFEKTKLLLPIDDNFELTEPDCYDYENNLNFYIPVLFNPDKYFEGIHVSTDENEDYVNLYLFYNIETDKIGLSIFYINNSGYDDGYADFDIDVELDEENEGYLRKKLFANPEFVEELKISFAYKTESLKGEQTDFDFAGWQSGAEVRDIAKWLLSLSLRSEPLKCENCGYTFGRNEKLSPIINITAQVNGEWETFHRVLYDGRALKQTAEHGEEIIFGCPDCLHEIADNI